MRIALMFAFVATSISTAMPFRNLRERGAAIWAMNKIPINGTYGIPKELTRMIQSFAVNNDWLTLEKALHRTSRTSKLLNLVQGRRKKVAKKGMKSRLGNLGVITTLVQTDGSGTITALDLSGQGLIDEDIVGGDLSRMPEGVTKLILSNNNLRCIKLNSPSKLLEQLVVSNNALQSVDIGELPTNLQLLRINGNRLKEVDLGSRNKALKLVDLSNNVDPTIVWDEDETVLFKDCWTALDPSASLADFVVFLTR